MRVENGWLLDAYVLDENIIVWIIGSDGVRRRFKYRFEPSCYVGINGKISNLLKPFGNRIRVERTTMVDVFLGREREVFSLTAPGMKTFSTLTRHLRAQRGLELFNVDIEPVQHFFYHTNAFPFCRVTVQVDEENVTVIKVEDSEWETQYELPPLRIIRMRLEGEKLNPKFNSRRRLVIEDGTSSCIYENTFANKVELEDFARSISEFMKRVDPDIIVTQWGDSHIMPLLYEIAEYVGVELHLNREIAEPIRAKDRTYFTYGRVVHQPGWFCLRGRIHIDESSSFIVREGGVRSLIELSRLTRVPVQRLARTTPGTGMTSMQLHYAYRNNMLIPLEKSQPENFKSAAKLIMSDRGGLVYRPKPGLYENVCEIDFASMFPTIMVNYNISPETVHCTCCNGRIVPELNYRVCTKRRGIVPAVLERLLVKRQEFKKLKMQSKNQSDADVYEDMQSGIKWMLVTCFGYLGYKNARFGKIEAHESVTAIAREILLQAKETAEERGFTFIHGIVDSLYIYKKGATPEEYAAIAKEISEKTGIRAEVEGIYKWILFVPRKQYSAVGVHNRFVGAFTNGKVKIRGLAARRHDVPPIIRNTQAAMIAVLASATNYEEYERLRAQAEKILERAMARIREGDIPITDLLFSRNLSRDASSLSPTSPSGIVCAHYRRNGIKLSAGMKILYLITNRNSPVPSERYMPFFGGEFCYEIDVEEYLRLLRESASQLTIPKVTVS